MAKILAEGRDLSKTFPARGQGKGAVLHGVSQVDLVVYEGETLALAVSYTHLRCPRPYPGSDLPVDGKPAGPLHRGPCSL